MQNVRERQAILKEVYDDVKSHHYSAIVRQNEENAINNQTLMQFQRPLSIGILTCTSGLVDQYLGYAIAINAAYSEHRQVKQHVVDRIFYLV